MAKKLTTDTPDLKEPIVYNEDVDFSSKPSKNVKDCWNQITLSLASNGGFTHEEGRKVVLDVLIQEKINCKTVSTVKSFYVTKQELADLEGESREFCAEIESMLIARDSEESKATSVKDSTKDTKKKDEPKKSGKALTEVLKKGLESVKKKEPVITHSNSEGDIEDPDDGMQDVVDDEHLARLRDMAEDLARMVDKDEPRHKD